MTGKFNYRAFGLNIVSDMELPELPPILGPHASIDLRIESGSQKTAFMLPDAALDFHRTPDGVCALRVNGVADFWVHQGSLIRMAIFADADEGMARLYLLGSAMGMALHQRGWMVMHASAVLQGGAVSLFVGDSGAGKSTLAAAFCRAGFGVLADDVMPIRVTGTGKFEVWPGARSFKLWADSLKVFGMERGLLSPIANRTEKYFVMNGLPVADAAYPLAEIIVLDTCAEEEMASLHILPKLESIRAISSNTYRPEYIDVLGRRSEHFKQCAELSAAIPVRRFRRPWKFENINSAVDILKRLSE